MNDLIYAPAWPTPGQRLEALLHCLEALRVRFKDAIARVVGGSVAQAVRDLVRMVLGNGPDDGTREGDDWAEDQNEDMWGERDDAAHEDAPEGNGGWLSSLVALLLACLGPIGSWAGTLLA